MKFGLLNVALPSRATVFTHLGGFAEMVSSARARSCALALWVAQVTGQAIGPLVLLRLTPRRGCWV